MNNIVAWITAIGLALVGLHFFGIDLPIKPWIDSWGEPVGNAIRSGLAAGVIVLYSLSMKDLQADRS